MESIYGSKTGICSRLIADDYSHLVTKDEDDLPMHTATGLSANIMVNRLSWFFNLLGLSINMGSACSSSLVALNFAARI